jgi:hypothetical protein
MGRRLPIVGAVAVIALAPAGRAGSDDVHVAANVHPGVLKLVSVQKLTAAGSVDGLPVHQLRVTIVDSRGHGQGWRLFAQPETGAGAVTLISIRTRCGAHSTCSLPSVAGARPAVVAGVGSVVVTAKHGEGMGKIEILVSVTQAQETNGQPLVFSLVSTP